ncbi:MAG TPA: S53 family peptidase [Solirubrobacteraceae bacterium]
MESGKGRASARRCALAIAVACAAISVGASQAAAATLRPAAPLAGFHVAFGCANPANHGRTGDVLGAANVAVGNGLRCFSQALAHGRGLGPQVMAGPTGLGPAQIQSAYKLGGLASGGKTVAVVDAFDDPNAASDLNKFRSTYGLPACTTASGCFKKESQTGSTTKLPSGDYGWAEEESLDLDAISSACPDCHILLVEASSAGTADLMAAEDTAAKGAGVTSISNSWGGSEDSTILSSDSHFNHPGIAITASSGDNGYGVSWPASSRFVTGVGGTTLSTASNARGWSEAAWSGAGSGCSAFEPKPAWQTDSGCAMRTVADVSADADPNSGLGVYDTYNNCGTSSFCDTLIEAGIAQGLDGWAQVGGTSLSSPLIASVYALAGNAATVTAGSFPYSHTASLFDVTSGSNGTCSPSYLCTAGAGYDGPTGLGTPNGTGGF